MGPLPFHRDGTPREPRAVQAVARPVYDVERAGAHVLPLGSYSPIPDTRRIPEATWAQPFDFGDAIDLRVEAQRELLADLSRWMPELADVPFAEDDARGGFY